MLTLGAAYAYDHFVLAGRGISWVLPLALVVGAGCASSAASNRQTIADERASVEKQQERAKQQADRIAELEVRVSLLEAEAKQLRAKLYPSSEFARETIRIGSSSSPGPPAYVQ